MRNGLLTVRVPAADEVPAARTGILLGAGERGPVQLRLFRQSGTRIGVAAALLPAQLLALRAALAAVPVDIGTRRIPTWEALLAAAPAIRLRSPRQLVPQPGAALVVHDEAAPATGTSTGANRAPTDVRPWQCRVDVYPEWTADQVTMLAGAHLSIIGRVPPADAAQLATTFGVPAQRLAAVPALPAQTVALLRRGRVEYVTVEPAEAEREVLVAAGAQLTAPRMAP